MDRHTHWSFRPDCNMLTSDKSANGYHRSGTRSNLYHWNFFVIYRLLKRCDMIFYFARHRKQNAQVQSRGLFVMFRWLVRTGASQHSIYSLYCEPLDDKYTPLYACITASYIFNNSLSSAEFLRSTSHWVEAVANLAADNDVWMVYRL
jgi:hypothetical protein